MKRCPYCAEDIQDAAVICRFCNRELAIGEEASSPTAAISKKSCWADREIRRRIHRIILLVGLIASMSETPSRSTTLSSSPAASVSAISPTPPSSNPPPRPEQPDEWIRSDSVSQLDDSKGVTYAVAAHAEVEVWLRSHRPTLLVRCRENETDVFMTTGGAATVESGDLEGHTVRVRYDDGQAQNQRWTESTSNDSLFAPNAIAMARRIATAQTVRIGWTPFNASPVVATFDVRGFERHVREIGETCSWRAGLAPARGSGATGPASTIVAPQWHPSQLSVSITAVGDGWRIQHLNSGYTWERCIAEIGGSKATLSPLESNGAVVVNLREFRPPIDSSTASPTISCEVSGTTFIATRSVE